MSKVNIGSNPTTATERGQAFSNILREAIHWHDHGRIVKALSLVDQAKGILTEAIEPTIAPV